MSMFRFEKHSLSMVFGYSIATDRSNHRVGRQALKTYTAVLV